MPKPIRVVPAHVHNTWQRLMELSLIKSFETKLIPKYCLDFMNWCSSPNDFCFQKPRTTATYKKLLFVYAHNWLQTGSKLCAHFPFYSMMYYDHKIWFKVKKSWEFIRNDFFPAGLIYMTKLFLISDFRKTKPSLSKNIPTTWVWNSTWICK